MSVRSFNLSTTVFKVVILIGISLLFPYNDIASYLIVMTILQGEARIRSRFI